MKRLSVALLVFLAPLPAAAAEPTDDPCAATVRVRYGVYAGSGTVIACEGGKCLVVTNGHVCPQPGAAVLVDTCVRPGEPRTYAGECVAASHPEPWRPDIANRAERGPDLALVVFAADGVPFVGIADADPPAGAEVRQWGLRGAKTGLFGRLFRSPDPAVEMVETTVATESGDSGSGVFYQSRLVAVTWGGRPGSDCVPLARVRAFVADKAARLFPRLAARLARPAAVVMPPPASKGDPLPAPKAAKPAPKSGGTGVPPAPKAAPKKQPAPPAAYQPCPPGYVRTAFG